MFDGTVPSDVLRGGTRLERTMRIAMSRKKPTSAIALFVMAAASLQVVGMSRTEANPIVRENRRSGTQAWRSPKLDAVIAEAQSATGDGDNSRPNEAAFPIPSQVLPFGRFVSGYTSKDSINQGENIELHLSAIRSPINVEIYRIGWYGGARSRLVWSQNGITGAYYAAPTANSNGTVEAAWPIAVTVPTDNTWTSGIYIAKLIVAGDTEYATWVIRNDSSTAPILLQVPTTTYQAYDNWGGASLYYPDTPPASPAVKVSYDRPYYSGDGVGLLFSGLAQTATFLEREGYDVAYATSTDTHTRPNLMDNHKLFLSSFHDEYWSKEMRDNLDNWIAAGKNVAFLSANNMYWQIRFEPSTSGTPNRIVVCYRMVADPITATNPILKTGLWHDPPMNRPEHLVTGNAYDELKTKFGWNSWIVSNANHWFYAGTGLNNGDALPQLVGIEWDLIPTVTPPADVAELSNSPMAPIGLRQQATIRTAPSGAQIFDAGSLRYPLFLDNYTADPNTAAVVQKMTRNLISRLSSTNPTPERATTPQASVVSTVVRGPAPQDIVASTVPRGAAPQAG